MIKKLIAYLSSFAHKQEVKIGERVENLVLDAEAEFDKAYQFLHANLEYAYTRAHELSHAAVVREQDAVKAAQRILFNAEMRLEDAVHRRANIQSTMGEVQDFEQEADTGNAEEADPAEVAVDASVGSKAAAE